jgi:hypothetical protein
MNITHLTPQQLREAADLQEKIVSPQKVLNQIAGSPGEKIFDLLSPVA